MTDAQLMEGWSHKPPADVQPPCACSCVVYVAIENGVVASCSACGYFRLLLGKRSDAARAAVAGGKP
jgi:hypothetical protein